MESDDKLRLIANRNFLVQNIQADEILDHLVAEQVLSDDDLERIEKMDTNKNKVRKILDTLPKKGPFAYKALKTALEENQRFIVDALDKTDLAEARKKRDAVKHNSKQKPSDTAKEPSAMSNGSEAAIGSTLFLELSGQSSVMRNWKDLARRLEVPESDIVDITSRERENLREQVYQSLNTWYERKGEDATIDELVKGLRKCKLNSVADSLGGKQK